MKFTRPITYRVQVVYFYKMDIHVLASKSLSVILKKKEQENVYKLNEETFKTTQWNVIDWNDVHTLGIFVSIL